MPIRLIDETATKPVDIDGTVFHIKQLSGAKKATLSLQMRPTPDGSLSGDMDSVLPTLACGIDRIEGFEGRSVLQVLNLIENPAHIALLFGEVLAYSTLSGDERKNSSSSPGSSSPEKKSATAGSPATSTKTQGSASPGTNESPASDQGGAA